jgi:hypothetical protein
MLASLKSTLQGVNNCRIYFVYNLMPLSMRGLPHVLVLTQAVVHRCLAGIWLPCVVSAWSCSSSYVHHISPPHWASHLHRGQRQAHTAVDLSTMGSAAGPAGYQQLAVASTALSYARGPIQPAK